MPRRRTHPPKTAFGAWLELWLHEHPDVTHQAFADDLGVSKGLISQWTAGDIKAISSPSLQAVARRTGADIGVLERMVYGATTRPAPTLDPAIVAEIQMAVRQEMDRLSAEFQALLRELLAERQP